MKIPTNQAWRRLQQHIRGTEGDMGARLGYILGSSDQDFALDDPDDGVEAVLEGMWVVTVNADEEDEVDVAASFDGDIAGWYKAGTTLEFMEDEVGFPITKTGYLYLLFEWGTTARELTVSWQNDSALPEETQDSTIEPIAYISIFEDAITRIHRIKRDMVHITGRLLT